MSKQLEALDRRAFLRGMMVTSAGLLVPKPVQVFMPAKKIYTPPTLTVHTKWSGEFLWLAVAASGPRVVGRMIASVSP